MAGAVIEDAAQGRSMGLGVEEVAEGTERGAIVETSPGKKGVGPRE